MHISSMHYVQFLRRLTDSAHLSSRLSSHIGWCHGGMHMRAGAVPQPSPRLTNTYLASTLNGLQSSVFPAPKNEPALLQGIHDPGTSCGFSRQFDVDVDVYCSSAIPGLLFMASNYKGYQERTKESTLSVTGRCTLLQERAVLIQRGDDRLWPLSLPSSLLGH